MTEADKKKIDEFIKLVKEGKIVPHEEERVKVKEEVTKAIEGFATAVKMLDHALDVVKGIYDHYRDNEAISQQFDTILDLLVEKTNFDELKEIKKQPIICHEHKD